jgi:cellulose synthase/poly-beta-1,6-N-acetylglucosamine synthase-like glycosyltransferase
LKPANILLDADNEPKIADFGLAVEDTQRWPKAAGTPKYTAPEIWKGVVYPNAQADIWSLGVILYEMITDNPPFDSTDPAELREQVLNRSPRAPSTIDAEIPVALEAACLKCLDKKPEHRYVSAARLEQHLRKWLDGDPVVTIRDAAVVIPCKYGRSRVERTIRHLSKSDQFEGVPIFVVDDSGDEAVWNELNSLAELTNVVLRRNRWQEQHKIGAIRTALDEVKEEFVILLDDDTVFDESSRPLYELISELNDADPRPADDCSFRILPASRSGVLGRCQTAEYAITTDTMRELLDVVGCVSGAASIWRRTSLDQLLAQEHSGAFDGDDLELTLLAYAGGMRIKHDSSVVALTAQPTSLRELLSQRIRWDWGLLRMLAQPRLWRQVFIRPTRIGALIRSLFLADVLLHPIKLFALLYPVYLCFTLIEPAFLVIPDERLDPALDVSKVIFSAFFMIGLLSAVWIRAPGSMRVKYALAWALYFGTLYLAFFAGRELQDFSQANLEPLIDSGSYMLLSPWQHILLPKLIPVVILLGSVCLWWVPLTFLLLRRSQCQYARRIGLHLLLLPLFHVLLLAVVRTVAMGGFLCFGWVGHRQMRKLLDTVAATLCAAACLLMLVVTYNLVRQSEPADTKTPAEWLAANMVDADNPLRNAKYLISYPNLDDRIWGYDTSLAVIAFTAAGQETDARSLLEGLRELQNPDGSWYRSYWLSGPTNETLDVISNAMTCIAAYNYQLQTGIDSYRSMADRALNWLAQQTVQTTVDGRSYTALPHFIDTSVPPPGFAPAPQSVSTRATIATFAACRFAQATGHQKTAAELAGSLRPYLEEAAWSEALGRFVEHPSEAAALSVDAPVDTQTWAVLALAPQAADKTRFRKALAWCEEHFERTVSGRNSEGGRSSITGLVYSDEMQHTVYAEGTLQAAASHQALGQTAAAQRWMSVSKSFRSRDGGVFYCLGARHPDLPRRPAASATCWFWLNSMQPPVNPFRPVILNSPHDGGGFF